MQDTDVEAVVARNDGDSDGLLGHSHGMKEQEEVANMIEEGVAEGKACGNDRNGVHTMVEVEEESTHHGYDRSNGRSTIENEGEEEEATDCSGCRVGGSDCDSRCAGSCGGSCRVGDESVWCLLYCCCPMQKEEGAGVVCPRRLFSRLLVEIFS